MARDWSKIETMGQTVAALTACKTKEEAEEFMREYRAITPHADVNIGYCTGYLDADEAKKFLEWCNVSHPIFGRKIPSDKEAFEAGVKLGEEERDKR